MFKIKNITKSIKHIKKMLTPSAPKTTYSSIVASAFDMETSNKMTSDLGFSKKYVVHNSKETDWVGIRKAIHNRFADEIHAWNKKQHGEIVQYSPARDVNEELEVIKEQGYSFAKQKAALKRSITDKWDEIERIKYLSQETLWNAKTQQKQLSHDDSIVGRMKLLSIKGYLSNYAGDDELPQSIDSVIKIKDTLITEFMQKVYDRHIHTTEVQQSMEGLINEQEVNILGEGQ